MNAATTPLNTGSDAICLPFTARMTSRGSSGTSLAAPAARGDDDDAVRIAQSGGRRRDALVDLDAEDAEPRHEILLGIGHRGHGVELAALLDRL